MGGGGIGVNEDRQAPQGERRSAWGPTAELQATGVKIQMPTLRSRRGVKNEQNKGYRVHRKTTTTKH